MACQVLVNGRACRAPAMKDRPYCVGHRRHRLADASASLADLMRLAEDFDRHSREVGELYPAAEFVAWCKPELAARD